MHVKENFKYYSGYNGNQAISSAIDEIQRAVHIPHISRQILNKISKYKDQNN